MVVGVYPSDDQDYAGIFTRRLVRALLELRQEVFVIKFQPWRGGALISRQLLDGVIVLTLALPFLPPYGLIRRSQITLFISDVSVWLISKIFVSIWACRLGKKDVDIVHSVGVGFNTIFADCLAKRYCVKHLSQAIGSDINIELPARPMCPPISRSLKRVAAFLCNSNALEVSLRKYLSYQPTTTTIYRGVDLDRFNLAKGAKVASSSEIKFLFLGGYWGGGRGDKKGVLSLLRAWSLYEKESVGDKPVGKLVLGGSNSELLKSHPLSAGLTSVEYLGSISPADIPGIMLEADIVIIPSLQEGFPNVGMEAFASGRPVLGSRVGGLPELVEDGVTGWLFEPGSEDELFNLIKRIVSGEYELQLMGMRARKFAEENLNACQYAPRVVELYSKYSA